MIKNRRRLLHVYAGNLYGGVETFLVTMARTPAAGLESKYALCYKGRLYDELIAAGASVALVSPPRLSRPWTVVKARRELAAIVGSDPPEAIVCHSSWPTAMFGPVASKMKIPLVFWMHDAIKKKTIVDIFTAREKPDLIVANSRYTASTLRGLFAERSAEVMFYPVENKLTGDTNAIRGEVRREIGAGENDVVVMQTSRMEPWKGQLNLIEALGRLRAEPNWTARFIGGAQREHERVYLEQLKERIGALGISDRVRFLGQRSDVARLLLGADIHCQPNQEAEPFGIVFVEALYAGLPIVTFDLGGAAEIVDDTCGVLVPPGDLASLAGALGGLIRDPERRARLGAAGPARARSICDPAARIAELESILETKLFRNRT